MNSSIPDAQTTDAKTNLKKIRIAIVYHHSNKEAEFIRRLRQSFSYVHFAKKVVTTESQYEGKDYIKIPKDEFTRRKVSRKFALIDDNDFSWSALPHTECDIQKNSVFLHITPKDVAPLIKAYPDTVVIKVLGSEVSENNLETTEGGTNIYSFCDEDFLQCFADVAGTISSEMQKIIVPFVGFASVGKERVTTETIAKVGGIRVDTGIFFRAIIWFIAFVKYILPDYVSDSVLEEFSETFNIKDYADGEMKENIRSPKLDSTIPFWSRNVKIREAIFWLQMVSVHSTEEVIVIVDGRDSVRWFRKGPFGFLVTCDEGESARRRWLDLKEKKVSYAQVLTSLVARNNNDRPVIEESNAYAPIGWLIELDNTTIDPNATVSISVATIQSFLQNRVTKKRTS